MVHLAAVQGAYRPRLGGKQVSLVSGVPNPPGPGQSEFTRPPVSGNGLGFRGRIYTAAGEIN